jgi:SAM-dependent methyltransferase
LITPNGVAPSDWVKRFISLIPQTEKGFVLDLACGSGRHSQLALEQGYQVLAVDLNTSPILELKQSLPMHLQNRLQVLEFDLETPDFPLVPEAYPIDGVIVTNYLYRPHIQQFLDLILPSGVIIYETFALGNEQFGKPSNPAFLLQKDELWQYIQARNDFSVVSFEQGYLERPKPAMIQRICAVKRNIIGLQLHYEN